MAGDSGHSVEDAAASRHAPGGSGASPLVDAADPGSAPGRGVYHPTPGHELRRRRIRLVANILIISASLALVGIVLYFVVTWLIASANQAELRDELAADNPGLTEAVENVSDEDFFTIGGLIDGVVEAEWQKKLAELKAAADDFGLDNTGRMGRALGAISIPAIGVETVMVEGGAEVESERYLRQGPGHWPETPLPGQGGSVVISGHRTTYGAPFRKLNDLEPGDEIELTMPYAILRYKVTQVIIVAPDDVQVVADQGHEMISLVACHPLHSARQRIIAQADLDSFVLLETEQ